jgi:methionyl-tRNA formyltransferase
MQRKAILLGSKPGSVVALLLLVQRGWTVTEVVASPSQAAWLPGPSLFEVASALGIRTVSHQDQLESSNADLVISYMYRSLVKPLTANRGRFAINFHAGPLPEFGGWAFYNLAILEGSSEYGCTCHIMDEAFDTGPLVKVLRFEIDSNIETALSLEKKTQKQMVLLFDQVVTNFERQNDFVLIPQPPDQMRYLDQPEFKKLKRIPDNASKIDIDRIARAFWYPPYEVAYYESVNGNKVEVIPEIARNEVAYSSHERSLTDLLQAANISLPNLLKQ